MKVGDLVQVLPAKIGYYIILEKVKSKEGYPIGSMLWDLHPFSNANFDHGGLMDEKYIEVISEVS